MYVFNKPTSVQLKLALHRLPLFKLKKVWMSDILEIPKCCAQFKIKTLSPLKYVKVPKNFLTVLPDDWDSGNVPGSWITVSDPPDPSRCLPLRADNLKPLLLYDES